MVYELLMLIKIKSVVTADHHVLYEDCLVVFFLSCFFVCFCKLYLGIYQPLLLTVYIQVIYM